MSEVKTMPANLLQGAPIANAIKEGLKKEIELLTAKYNKAPKLVSVQVGDNAASSVYVRSQQKAATALGINYELKTLPQDIKPSDMCKTVESLNGDSSVNGIIVQLPLPKQIDSKEVSCCIDPIKDAEGMHPENLGRIIRNEKRMWPCTPQAVMELLKATNVKLYGKEAVVVGHSEIVGKPLSLMLLNEFVTTTVCHIATGERGLLPEHVKRAEILIVAVGRAGIVKGEWVKEGAIVIDVGINKVGDKIVGDVEFEEAKMRASFITPVPGGVGPLTVTMLMRNAVEAFKLQVR